MVNILDDLSSILRCNYMHALVMIQGLGVRPHSRAMLTFELLRGMHGVKCLVTQTLKHLVNCRSLYSYQNSRPISNRRSDL